MSTELTVLEPLDLRRRAVRTVYVVYNRWYSRQGVPQRRKYGWR